MTSDVIMVENVVFNSENLPAPWLSLNQIDLSVEVTKIIMEGKDEHINIS